MQETVSIHALKALVEEKVNRKVVIKVIWNEQEKLTLLLTPNMNIHSFIYDEQTGYQFYDQEGNLVTQTIPLIVPENHLLNGQVLLLEEPGNSKLKLNEKPLSQEDKAFLANYHKT